ncbi:MAG TPA: hypothetical protein VIK91_13090, partial [Nannocystis sp.]
MRAAARHGAWRIGWALLVAPAVVAGSLAGCGTPPDESRPVDPDGEVALLAVVEGEVKVRREGGGEVVATVDMPLSRSDTVITPPGALAVVVLANGYVIKLEEDQATPVRALAHLDDPPARENLAELFERALGAETFARVGGAERIERIAGWNARRAAGETPAPVPRLERPAEPAPAPPPAPPGGDVLAEEVDDAPAGEAAGVEAERPADRPSESVGGAGGGARQPESNARAPKKNKGETGQSGSIGKSEGGPPAEEAKTGSAGPSGGGPVPGRPQAPSAPKGDLGPIALVDAWTFEPLNQKAVPKVGLPALLRTQRHELG